MAEKAGLSRICRTFGLKPHVSESFKLSPDPQLIAKVRDVVGLYMNPPANAVVFAVDEKSQIQALERAQPILPMDLGHAGPVRCVERGDGRSNCALKAAAQDFVTS